MESRSNTFLVAPKDRPINLHLLLRPLGFRVVLLMAVVFGWLTLDTNVAADEITFYHNDALGSPVAATDATGVLLWRETYQPFGTRIRKELSDNEIWYTGKPQNEATGLVKMGARRYSPEIGRFISPDPADGLEQSPEHLFNRYAYANNNPYRYVDPDGNFPVLLALIGAELFNLAIESYDNTANPCHDCVRPSGAGTIAAFGFASRGRTGTVVSDAIGANRRTTQSGIGVTRHSVQKKINRQVRSADELDAIKNPLDVKPVKVDQLGRPSQRSIGRKAEVARNPETGDIVSVNPTSTKKAERLLRRQGR